MMVEAPRPGLVNPARAGMILCTPLGCITMRSKPRASGDDPEVALVGAAHQP